MKKLFLVDAYALIFKYYYAFLGRPMRNRAGMNTSVVFGFVKFLRDIQKRERPDLLGVAFDPKGGSFRREIFPEYKANRAETPEDILLSVPYVPVRVRGEWGDLMHGLIESQKQYVASVKDTVLLHDIVKRKPVRDVTLLDDTFIYLVNNASNLFSVQNLINFFKSKNRRVSYDTLSNYLGYIGEAFLAYRTERYNIKGKDVVAGNCKYYLNDLSFKNFLYPGFSYGVGCLLENAVCLELRQLGYSVYVCAIRDKEVDFVAMKDDRVIYLQTTYMLETEQTIEREYSPLLSIKDNDEKYVVSLDEIQLPSKEGIRHIQTYSGLEFE